MKSSQFQLKFNKILIYKRIYNYSIIENNSEVNQKKGKMKKSNLINLLLTILILTGCAAPKPILTIPQGFQDKAKPMAENIINGLDKQDYPIFSKDFDQKMIEAIPSTAMAEVHKLLWSQFGEYQTIQTRKIFEEKNFYVGVFILIFEKGDIDMQVVFSQTEPYKVSGLWFPNK
jgi:hypothetical protein